MQSFFELPIRVALESFFNLAVALMRLITKSSLNVFETVRLLRTSLNGFCH